MALRHLTYGFLYLPPTSQGAIMKITKHIVHLMILCFSFALVWAVQPAYANAPGPLRTLAVASSTTTIRHVQFSGLLGHKSGYARVTATQFHYDIAKLADRTDLITTTEVVTRARGQALRLSGWGLCWQRGDQTAIVFRKDMFTVSWCGVKRVSRVKYFQEASGHWVLPARVTAAVLRIKATRRRVLVTVNHTISCAFSRNRPGWIPSNETCAYGRTSHNLAFIQRNARRVPAYKADVQAWATWVDRLEQRYRPDAVITTGDFNLDFKKSWARSYLHTVWQPVMRQPQFSWQTWQARDYTHLMETYHGTYHVLLDGDLVSGAGVSYEHSSVALPEQVSSDHSPTEDVVYIPAS